jgi:hypothetical protein
MTSESPVPVMQRGLSPISGRLLWFYRALWATLATVALVTMALALLDPSLQPVVLGLRLAKSAIVGTVAWVLFWRRQRDPVAAILSLAFLCWTITSSFDFTTAAILPMLLDRLRFFLFALALLLFPDGKWRSKWARAVAFASGAVFMLGVFEASGLAATRLFLPLAILCVLAAITALIQRFRQSSDDAQRQQLKWVALGLVAGIGLILTARAAASLAGPAIAFEAIFQLGIVVVALGFLVPLLRYRLYDAEVVISRSAAYAVLTAALVATFAGSEALIESLGQNYLGSEIGQVSEAMAAALAAVLLTPLNDRINRWAEQRFQRNLVQLRTELPELLSEMPDHWSSAQVGKVALQRLSDVVHATHAAIILKGKAVACQGMPCELVDGDPGNFAFRLAMKCPFGGHHGWLLLGPRPDGSSYGKDDVEAFQAIAPALRRALLASQAREVERERAHMMRRQILDRIAAISATVAVLENRQT